LPPYFADDDPSQKTAIIWAKQFLSVQTDLARIVHAYTTGGKIPFMAGARIEAVVAAAQTAFGFDTGLAMIFAVSMQSGAAAQRASYEAVTKVLPQQVVDSWREAAFLSGSKTQVNEAAVRAIVRGEIGQLTTDYARMSKWAQQQLRYDLAEGVRKGENPRKIAKRLDGYIQNWFRSGQSRSVMIARTTTARAYDVANRHVYIDAAERGLIKGWQWRANRFACDICATLNGMIFEAWEDTYRHPNCQCQTVPVLIDEEGEVGERVDPFPGTVMSDIRLKKSKSGWTNWTIKPKAQREGTWKPYAKIPRNKFLPDRIPHEMVNTT
jgi:SPP1 gp7 family putative phage head morphogenesis protein